MSFNVLKYLLHRRHFPSPSLLRAFLRRTIPRRCLSLISGGAFLFGLDGEKREKDIGRRGEKRERYREEGRKERKI
jgi:hypothetical protein